MQPRAARNRLPLRRRTHHVRQPCIYKEGAKEIAAKRTQPHLHGKFNEREGNSCHIHISVRGNGGGYDEGDTVWSILRLTCALAARKELHRRAARHMRELILLSAQINSYKRFVQGRSHHDRGWDTTTARVHRLWARKGFGWRTEFQGRYQPVSGHAGLVAAGSMASSASSTELSCRQCYDATCRRCRTRCRALELWENWNSPGARSATRSSTTTQTWPGSSYAYNSQSPTGSFAATSNDSERQS